MFNYTDAIQILKDSNIILIIAICIISLCVYVSTKNHKIKIINFIYFIEFIIFTLILIDNNNKKSGTMYFLLLYIFFKLVYFSIFKKILSLENKEIYLLIGMILSEIISIFIEPIFFYLINLGVNLIVIKKISAKYLNNNYTKLDKNLKKISINKRSLIKIDNEINKEKLIQQEYENKIISLENKTNKAINEADMAIFILDEKNSLKEGNTIFRNMFTDYKSLELLDIFYYINKKFINSSECIELINSISTHKNKSVELYTLDEMVYKFTCIQDIRNNENVKICILNDITQSNIIQKKLRESEEKYRKLMDILSDGVIIHDMKNITYINDAALNLFNLDNSIENINLSHIKESINVKNIEKLMGNIKFVHEGRIEKLNNKVKINNGLFVEVITTQININNVNMLLTIIIDITTMEKAIRDLAESKKSYKMVIQNLPEGVVIIDKKTKNYIYQNRAMIKILKVSGIESMSKIINNYIESESYGISKKYNFKNKDISSVSLTIIDTKDENQLVGIVRCLDDEERIKQALKELDSINLQYEVKNDFLTKISQNLNNPINTIATANNLLEYNKLKYDSKYINSYNQLIKRNCYRLQRLISNMNEIVELENGFYSMEYTNCDIVKFIKNLVHTANEYLEDKGIEIEFKTNIDKKIMKIDLDKMEKVILNLLSNAIKFSEQGSDISVGIKENGKYIDISVEDNGVGIPKDKLNFIFTKFAQVDKTLTRNAEGSGVGLSIVKRFIELHDGKVEVESNEGMGSKFTIKLKNNSNLRENKRKSKVKIESEKMHIEFADIYF